MNWKPSTKKLYFFIAAFQYWTSCLEAGDEPSKNELKPKSLQVVPNPQPVAPAANQLSLDTNKTEVNQSAISKARFDQSAASSKVNVNNSLPRYESKLKSAYSKTGERWKYKERGKISGKRVKER